MGFKQNSEKKTQALFFVREETGEKKSEWAVSNEREKKYWACKHDEEEKKKKTNGRRALFIPNKNIIQCPKVRMWTTCLSTLPGEQATLAFWIQKQIKIYT